MSLLDKLKEYEQDYSTAMGLLTQVRPAIAALESAYPEVGQGALKLAALKASIQGYLTTAGVAYHSFESIWNVISPVVSVFVPAVRAEIVAVNAALAVVDQVVPPATPTV